MRLSPITGTPKYDALTVTVTTVADETHGPDGKHKLSAPRLQQFSNAQVRRLTDYIQANLDCALNASDLANLVQLRPRQFSRMFSSTFGTTPHRYIMRERVARAKNLLSKGRPLVEIACDLGFASQSHFSCTFHKAIGVSPGRFRQEHRS
jgi:AraC family transcriptional regulator